MQIVLILPLLIYWRRCYELKWDGLRTLLIAVVAGVVVVSEVRTVVEAMIGQRRHAAHLTAVLV